MPVDSELLVDHLRRLRKGRAARAAGLARLLTAELREAFRVEEHEPDQVVRQRLRSVIGRRLPDEPHEMLRTVALTALALVPDADERWLMDRERALANRLNCHPRTIRRRTEAAFLRLARALAEDETAGSADDGFTVRRLTAVMLLNGAVPQLTEHRIIEVTADRLTAIVCRLSVPVGAPGSAPGGIQVRDVIGGSLVRQDRTSGETFLFEIEPSAPLARGDVHEYGVTFRLPEGQVMRPHYAYVPVAPCREFDLTVRFDPARLPEAAWWFDGVLPRAVDDPNCPAEPGVPDTAGWARRSFRNPRNGLAYGLGWRHLIQ